MAAYWIWWVLAAVLIGAELMTGTFYLLAVGVAFAAGGISAWLGLEMSSQMLIGGVVGVLATIAVHQWRLRRALPAPQAPLDVGQSVRVQTWKDDGGARVEYRGTQWDAELATPSTARAETMFIVGTRGSVLVLADRRP